MNIKKLLNDRIYLGYIHDLINEQTLSLEKYVHHHHTTRLRHCLNVSYKNYKICTFLRLDARSAARAGLLHDFFFYNRCDYTKNAEGKGHLRTHPEIANINALSMFNLTPKESDIILKHMWPITLKRPKFKETVVIIFVDKYCALLEALRLKNKSYRI